MSERHRGQQAESNTAVAEEAPSVRERYQALKLAHQLNVQYARDLQAKEQTAVLTAAEVDAIHTASVADLAAMPRAFQDRVGIPDPAILRQWMASSLPAEVSPVVFVRALTQGEHARALDVDPCLKPLSPRALRNYLERR